MFARSVRGGCSDSTAVLDRESNAFSSCAIMLLLRAAAAVAGASQRALYWRRGRESTPSLHVSEPLHVISQESRYVPEINANANATNFSLRFDRMYFVCRSDSVDISGIFFPFI